MRWERERTRRHERIPSTTQWQKRQIRCVHLNVYYSTYHFIHNTHMYSIQKCTGTLALLRSCKYHEPRKRKMNSSTMCTCLSLQCIHLAQIFRTLSTDDANWTFWHLSQIKALLFVEKCMHLRIEMLQQRCAARSNMSSFKKVERTRNFISKLNGKLPPV